MVGMTMSVSTAETIRPPMLTMPRGCRISAPAEPIPRAMGIMPRMIARVDMMIGLSFVGQAWVSAVFVSFPCLRSVFV